MRNYSSFSERFIQKHQTDNSNIVSTKSTKYIPFQIRRSFQSYSFLSENCPKFLCWTRTFDNTSRKIVRKKLFKKLKTNFSPKNLPQTRIFQFRKQHPKLFRSRSEQLKRLISSNSFPSKNYPAQVDCSFDNTSRNFFFLKA